jgi:hypothetical protein
VHATVDEMFEKMALQLQKSGRRRISVNIDHTWDQSEMMRSYRRHCPLKQRHEESIYKHPHRSLSVHRGNHAEINSYYAEESVKRLPWKLVYCSAVGSLK